MAVVHENAAPGHDKEQAKQLGRPGSQAEQAPTGHIAPFATQLLALQRSAGNRAVSRLLHGPAAVQRWAALGDENYHSPAHTSGGTGIIAGVPEPGEGRVETRTLPVMEATESEWRDLLNGGGDQPAITVYAFLRAAMLNDAEWLEHVRNNYDGIPPQTQLMREVGTSFSTADRRIRVPSEEQQLALAKAIYLRGRTGIGFDFDRFRGLGLLMRGFIARMQPLLIERMAAGNVRFGPENLGPVGRATSTEQQGTMVGSAAGTLTRAGATFAAWDRVKRAAQPRSAEETNAEQQKMLAMREAEMAGITLRGVADTAATIRREQIELYKNIIGIALAAVPMPAVGRFLTGAITNAAVQAQVQAVITKAIEVVGTDRLKDGLAGALARADHTERIQDIRTEAVRAIREFRLGDEEDDFVNTVNATLIGAGR